jgi:hypothetical protein
MATHPKSKAVETYRREISAYLSAVRGTRGWKLVKMGEAAGGLKHTTISRAIRGEHTISFPALLALEAASGVSIPDSLRLAAIGAQHPAPPDVPSAAEIARIAAELRGKSPEYQRALLVEIERNLAKASA